MMAQPTLPQCPPCSCCRVPESLSPTCLPSPANYTSLLGEAPSLVINPLVETCVLDPPPFLTGEEEGSRVTQGEVQRAEPLHARAVQLVYQRAGVVQLLYRLTQNVKPSPGFVA